MPKAGRESPAVSVARAMDILESVALRAEGMTNSDISRRLKIPKSSASYILRVLESRNYLRRDRETGRYILGLKLLGLSKAVQLGKEIRGAALPSLRQLVHATELTAHAAVLDRGEAVYVERVEAPGFIKMDTWVGRRMQVNTTSVGKAIVAFLHADEIREIVETQGLMPRTPKSIISRPRFLKELERVRQMGYAVDDEENNLGARCLAAPVFNAAGEVVGALGVSGATSQITRTRLPKVAVLVREAARRVSHQMGHRGSPPSPAEPLPRKK